MNDYRVGRIGVNVWEAGYPIWIEFSVGGSTLKISHHELFDLEYAVQSAIRKARQELVRFDRAAELAQRA